jgi:enoyl-CoA hydratase/carnithine racemase
MRDALTEAFQLVRLDPDITSVEVSANGPCFSAGGDLSEFGTVTDPMTAHEIRLRRMPARFLAAIADRCHVRVHGACVGAGIELPAFAGRISAAPDTFFQLPEVGMGLIPGAGGCVSIPRRIGRQRTAYMALTGRRIEASLALAWGLIDGVDG